ncbi:DsbA family oxidoreductase [Nonomuraea sp. NPDC050790]|uniref:DsbA family oxidoreductase n=1 Tax=Nonomuraea sp. NPDC050790 TaxID=3364371 RepID=UPI003791FD72
MTAITVDIWSDLVCPWCYIGHRRFEHALAAFEHRDAVQVRHRSFELDPHGSREPTLTLPERMRRDLGLPAPQAREGMARVAALAAEVGLDYRLDLTHPVNSFDAHRIQRAAADRGVGDAVRERLMRAYTGEGANVADHATLVRLAAEAGLDRDFAAEVLKGDSYGEAVRADEAEARRTGVSGVPAFVFAGHRMVAGAQPTAVFAQELDTAWRQAEHQ